MLPATISRFSRLISLLVTSCLLSLPAYAKYSGGTGAPDDPYQIATAEDLILLGESPEDYDKHYILIADIDLDPNLRGRKVFDKAVIAPDANPNDWGAQGTPFTGVFDGSGRTISYLTIRGKSCLGLFGQLSSGANISNLGLLAVDVNGTGDYIGGLAGNNTRGYITNSYITGKISGDGIYSQVGGLVGFNRGNISNCRNAGMISGLWTVGGLVGCNYGSVTKCYSTGTIIGYVGDYGVVGGLAGDNGGDITDCHSTGTVSGDDKVGGLAGNNQGNINNSYSTGTVRGGWSTGGLVGYNYSDITNCYSNGNVSGDDVVGGLVGNNAGLMGNNVGNITNSYSTGTVAGRAYVAGLVGYNNGNINTSYSTGTVSGDRSAGGFVGYNRGSITHCVWDIEASGFGGSAGGVNLSTAEMMSPYMLGLNGFANDPNWVLDAGRDYPRLAWEGAPGQIIPEPDIDWLEGEGTLENPYRVDTAEQIILLGKVSIVWDRQFFLGSDIDLNPNLPNVDVFSQAVIPGFSGVFNGNGHKILHLTIKGGSYLGLFGQLDSGAKISNLGLDVVDVNGTDESIGGIVGKNGGDITNCCSNGSVKGNWFIGGLVGYNAGDITNSYSNGTVSGHRSVGSLVGYNEGDITKSYSTSMVSGDDYVGGRLVGYHEGNIAHGVLDIEVSGPVGSNRCAGLTTSEMMNPYMLGLNGFANDPNWVLDAGRDYLRLAWEGKAGQIIPKPNTDWLQGEGTSQNPYVIDTADQLILLGKASILWDKNFLLGADIDLAPSLPNLDVFTQAVIPSFNGVFEGNGHKILHLTIKSGSYLGLFGWLGSGAVISNLGMEEADANGIGNEIGALAGVNEGIIINCYSSGEVNGYAYVGGLVGKNSGNITNSYGTSTVEGLSRVGGIVGEHWEGLIINCYSTGKVSGHIHVGGLVGDCWGGVVESSFWDVEASGQLYGVRGTGKPTAEMQTAGTFLEAGWDFADETANGTEDIWWILEGQDYPRLWWEEIEQ